MKLLCLLLHKFLDLRYDFQVLRRQLQDVLDIEFAHKFLRFICAVQIRGQLLIGHRAAHRRVEARAHRGRVANRAAIITFLALEVAVDFLVHFGRLRNQGVLLQTVLGGLVGQVIKQEHQLLVEEV